MLSSVITIRYNNNNNNNV